jgi:hypothetical protein
MIGSISYAFWSWYDLCPMSNINAIALRTFLTEVNEVPTEFGTASHLSQLSYLEVQNS